MQNCAVNAFSWVATGEYNLSRESASQYSITYPGPAQPSREIDETRLTGIYNASAADCPVNAQPFVRFTTPVLKHPHMFSDGRVCLGGFPLEDSLAERMCIRIFRSSYLIWESSTQKALLLAALGLVYQVNKQQLPLERVSLPTLSDGLVVKHRDHCPLRLYCERTA